MLALACEQARAERAALLITVGEVHARAMEARLDDVVTLSLEVVRTLLARDHALSRELVARHTREAMTRMRRARVMRVRVHPDDAEALDEGLRRLWRVGRRDDDLLVEGDATLERGGVFVETELGTYNARLDALLEHVARILDVRAPIV